MELSEEIEEVVALAQRRLHQWVLLGFELRELRAPDTFARPTFGCPRCSQQVRLMLPETKLPVECPRCKAKLGEPDGALNRSAGLS